MSNNDHVKNRLNAITEHGFVFQDWMTDVGLKMQSILLSGLRSPDVKSPNTKRCVRWLRRKALIDAHPEKQDYMEKVQMTEELIWESMEELQYLTVHYVHHFADAFAVLGYFHPDNEAQEFAQIIHNLVAVELFHFKPETKEEFIHRHRDYPDEKKKKKREVIANIHIFKKIKEVVRNVTQTSTPQTEILPRDRSY